MFFDIYFLFDGRPFFTTTHTFVLSRPLFMSSLFCPCCAPRHISTPLSYCSPTPGGVCVKFLVSTSSFIASPCGRRVCETPGGTGSALS